MTAHTPITRARIPNLIMVPAGTDMRCTAEQYAADTERDAVEFGAQVDPVLREHAERVYRQVAGKFAKCFVRKDVA